MAASYAPQANPAAVINVLALISDPRPPAMYRLAPWLRLLRPPNAPCNNAPMSLSADTVASYPTFGTGTLTWGSRGRPKR